MDWMNHIDILSAALVPLIAIAGAVIGTLQYKTNERRRRHELFDKRLPLYQATADFVSSVIDTGSVDPEKLKEILKMGVGSQFLFGEDVRELMQTIVDSGVHLRRCDERCNDLNQDEEERELFCQKRGDLLAKFRDIQGDLPHSAFRQYMLVEKPGLTRSFLNKIPRLFRRRLS